MQNSLGLTRQRQLEQNEEIKRNFQATGNLAKGLLRERITVKHELHKISDNKSKLEELKALKKANKNKKKENKDLVVARTDKSEVKAVGFNIEGYSSLKGKKMIEAQRDSRRQRHIQAIKECEQFLEQFYENLMEK